MNLSESYKKRLQELAGFNEELSGAPFSALNYTVLAEKEEDNEKDEIHLPELTMSKKELAKFLKDIYGINIK